jgi:Fanconi-associated nuclease 1
VLKPLPSTHFFGRYAEAADLLHQLLQGACCPSRRGDWWQRMSIDLEHKGDVEASLLVSGAIPGAWSLPLRASAEPLPHALKPMRTPSSCLAIAPSPQAAEAALNDRWVRHGDLLALQRRVLRLGKPPRRWKRPRWAAQVSREPPEVIIPGRPTASVVGVKSR